MLTIVVIKLLPNQEKRGLKKGAGRGNPLRVYDVLPYKCF